MTWSFAGLRVSQQLGFSVKNRCGISIYARLAVALTLCHGWLILLMTPPFLQSMKIWLLFALVVTLLLVGGYVSIKPWGKETIYIFVYLSVLFYLYICLFFLLNMILTSSSRSVHISIRPPAWLIRGWGACLLVHGKPGLTMATPPCLVPLGHLWVGHHDLQPLQFWFTLLLGLFFLVDEETLALCRVPQLRPWL